MANSSTPKDIPLHLLKEITKEFSQKLGSGGYGEVYKGMYNGEEIAVKKLHYCPGLDDVQFRNEFNNLMRVHHKNIVRDYMPPEYISNRHISNKNDVFSLGVIVIQIMTGPLGFNRRQEMSSQEFIESVHKNWRERIEETSKDVEEYSQQAKRCIEIALKCVEVDKNKRPTIVDIIDELKKAETMIHEMSMPFSQEMRNVKGREMVQKEKEVVSVKAKMEGKNGKEEIPEQETMNEKAKVEKIGPWGGNSGSPNDIEVAPRRLNSVIIGSGEVINSIVFSYSDYNGQQYTAGPWGGKAIPCDGDAPYAGSYHTIQLGPSEFLMKIFGTIGPFYDVPANVVTSLTLVTNAGNYGPFGQGGGSPFHTPMQRNGSIVGFFARTGWYVDAIGVYVNPKQEIMTEEEGRVARIGLWGGNSGSPYDIEVPPRHLKSVIIGSGEVINSLVFSYSDYSGQQHTAGPWGGNGPYGRSYHTIQFGPSEFLVEVSGTIGSFTDAPDNVVTSLALVTNTSSYGPYGGRGGGAPFQTPIQSNGSIAGFFVRAGWYVDAIGVYVCGF